LRAAAHPSHPQVPGELGAEAPDRHDDAERDKRDPGDGDDGPDPVRLMAGDAEGHHDRDHPDDDVGDAASDEAHANMLRAPDPPADLLPEPPPLRREYGRP
jgi:hypothetical protein